jgi:AAA domain/RepB DNA-primase N-terminal domain
MQDKFLRRVWGAQAGYVFLPHKTDRWVEPPAIEWPTEEPIEFSLDADSYFCPNLFSKPRRIEENVKPLRWLYADLDTVDPRKLDLPPTIAIRTSPGRFQGLWELRKAIAPKSHRDLNQRLTYATGADKGGWHLTKVLRVPGTYNYKYPTRKKVEEIWDNEIRYTTGQIKDFVKGVELHQIDPQVTGITIPAETAASISRRIWDRLDSRTRGLLGETEEQPEGERSDRLWELECRLLEHGVEPEEVFVLVRDSVWNKFADRRNADDYLWREIRKAHLHVGTQRDEDAGGEHGLVRLRPNVVSYADLLGSNISEPAWLVEDWWTLGSHGIIAGLPKSYKSLISLDLAVSVASESRFLGLYDVNPKAVGPALIIQQENSLALLRDRLWKITKNRGLYSGKVKSKGGEIVVEFPPSIPLFFYNDFGFNMALEEDRNAIEELIQREGIKLVVFDPLYLMIGGADENNAREMRPILSWLLQIRNRYNCAVVVVHHWGKGSLDKKGRGVGGIKLLGSTTIYGWLEAALYLEAKSSDDGYEVVVEREFRERLSPPPTGFELQMGDIGSERYEWSPSGAVGSHNRILAMLEEVGVEGMDYRHLQTAMNVGQKKIRAELAPLLNDGSIVVHTVGKKKRFYLAERAPEGEQEG